MTSMKPISQLEQEYRDRCVDYFHNRNCDDDGSREHEAISALQALEIAREEEVKRGEEEALRMTIAMSLMEAKDWKHGQMYDHHVRLILSSLKAAGWPMTRSPSSPAPEAKKESGEAGVQQEFKWA